MGKPRVISVLAAGLQGECVPSLCSFHTWQLHPVPQGVQCHVDTPALCLRCVYTSCKWPFVDTRGVRGMGAQCGLLLEAWHRRRDPGSLEAHWAVQAGIPDRGFRCSRWGVGTGQGDCGLIHPCGVPRGEPYRARVGAHLIWA